MNDARPDGDEDMAISKLINEAGPRAEPSAQRVERVRAAVHDHWQAGGEAPRSATPWAWVAGVAAALVLTIGVFTLREPATSESNLVARVIAQRGDVRVAESQGALEAGTTVETGADGMINLRLASGHEVRVQQDTRVVIAAATQLSLTHGTVYLDSGIDGASESLKVITPFGNATDIGTQFEVSVDTRSLEVVVREGLVALETLPSSAATFATTIEHGAGVRVDGAGAATEFTVSPWDKRWGWTGTLTSFGKASATGREYIGWVIREFGLTLRPQGVGIEQKLGGAITGLNPDVITDLDAELEDALQSLSLGHRLEEDGVLVIFDLPQR